jgi:hypothetical protein
MPEIPKDPAPAPSDSSDDTDAMLSRIVSLTNYDWWFGKDDLSASDVEAQADWKEHPVDALEGGQGLTLYRRASDGSIECRDAAALLTVFACREAAQLLGLWNPPGIVTKYLSSCDPRLSEQAAAASNVALEEADKERQNAAMLVKEAQARCPKLGFFSRAATRAAAWVAAQDYAKAVAAYRHREAAMYAIEAALLATMRGTPLGANGVVEASINAAGISAAEEGVITSFEGERPNLLPPGSARSAGRGAATVNIRYRFSTMVEHLFA